MNLKTIARPAVIGIGLLAFSPAVTFAFQNSTQPDNTKMNQQANQGATADSQKNNRSDVQITADIRKAVVGDSSLSTNAHNVKIITRHGKVTLKGPVASDDEKSKIEQMAKQVAGDGNVTDNITIKAGKSSKSM